MTAAEISKVLDRASRHSGLRRGPIMTIDASTVIARSEATKQSIVTVALAVDCFASLAMTETSGLRHSTDLPVGQISEPSDFLSSLIFKNISLRARPKSNLYPSTSHPTEGRIMIVTNAGRDAVDAAAPARYVRDRRAGFPCAVRVRADERCFRGRRSRVVLTPRRRRQVRGGFASPTGLGQNPIRG